MAAIGTCVDRARRQDLQFRTSSLRAWFLVACGVVSCVQLVQAGGEEIEALTISPLPLTGMIPRRVSWMAGSCTATSLAVDCAGPEVSPTPVVGKRKLAYSCPILECLCSRDCQIVQLLSSSIFNPNLRTKLLAYSVRYKNACCLQRKESWFRCFASGGTEANTTRACTNLNTHLSALDPAWHWRWFHAAADRMYTIMQAAPHTSRPECKPRKKPKKETELKWDAEPCCVDGISCGDTAQSVASQTPGYRALEPMPPRHRNQRADWRWTLVGSNWKVLRPLQSLIAARTESGESFLS